MSDEEYISETQPIMGEAAAEAAPAEPRAHSAGGKPKHKDHPALYATAVSTALDVLKGVLVPLMLVEHAREVLLVPFYQTTALQFVSNTANATCMMWFTFAYGYSCYRAYLSDCSPRTEADQRWRCARSAAIIWAFACVNDIVLAWRTSGLPSLDLIVKIVIGYEVYWSFVRTFPVMLGVMLACSPVIDAAYSGKTRGARLAAGFALLAVPLVCSCVHVAVDCTSGLTRFVPLFLDCTLKPPSLIFPALPHLVHFNAGVLAAMLVRRWTTPGIPVLSSRRPRLTELLGLVLGAGAVSTCFGMLLLTYREMDWSILDAGMFRRFPPNVPWLLAGLSYGLTLLVAAVLVLPAKGALGGSGSFGGAVTSAAMAYFEHLGANVLLYLTVSNILFFSVPTATLSTTAWNSPGSGAPQRGPGPWDPFCFVVFALTIIGLLHILIKGSRK